MTTTLCFLGVNLIEALIFEFYSLQLFYQKHSKLKTTLISIACYMLPFLGNLLKLPAINLFTFCVANFLILKLTTKNSVAADILHASISTVLMTLAEILVVNYLINAAATFYSQSYFLRNFIITAILGKFLYFILLQVVAGIFRKCLKESSNLKTGNLLLAISCLFSLFLIATLVFICEKYTLSTQLDVLIGISVFLLFMLNFLLAWYYSYMQQKNVEFTDLQLYLQHENIVADYQKKILKIDETQKILIHDIKKHLYSISSLCENSTTADIKDYVSRIIQSSSLEETRTYSDRYIMNAILSRYNALAKEQHTNFIVDIRDKSFSFVPDDHITTIFCNLLDNALNATKNMKSSYIDLSVSRNETANLTMISMINSCLANPFTSNVKRQISTPGQFHGYGLKSVEKIVHLYNGDMQIYFEEKTNSFHTVLTLRNTLITSM